MSLKVQDLLKTIILSPLTLGNPSRNNSGQLRSQLLSVIFNHALFLLDFEIFGRPTFFYSSFRIAEIVVAKLADHLCIVYFKSQSQSSQTHQFKTRITKSANKSVEIVHTQEIGFLLHGHQPTDATDHLKSSSPFPEHRSCQFVVIGLTMRCLRIL